MIGRLQAKLTSLQVDKIPLETVPQSSYHQREETNLRGDGMKLPKLHLETFSSELANWMPFWDQSKRPSTRTLVSQFVKSSSTFARYCMDQP